MYYQIRLMDQNLPGLVRELALACWNSLEGEVDPAPDKALYRALYGGMRNLLRVQVKANRYCGGARSCERGLPSHPSVPVLAHEAYPGEHVHIYLLESPYDPDLFVEHLVGRAVRSAARRYPHQSPGVLANCFRRAVSKTLRNRVFASFPCGQSPLCGMNESYDPWDLRDPINRLVPVGTT